MKHSYLGHNALFYEALTPVYDHDPQRTRRAGLDTVIRRIGFSVSMDIIRVLGRLQNA